MRCIDITVFADTKPFKLIFQLIGNLLAELHNPWHVKHCSGDGTMYRVSQCLCQRNSQIIIWSPQGFHTQNGLYCGLPMLFHHVGDDGCDDDRGVGGGVPLSKTDL